MFHDCEPFTEKDDLLQVVLHLGTLITTYCPNLQIITAAKLLT